MRCEGLFVSKGVLVVWMVGGEGERTYNRMKKKREGRRVEEILCLWCTLGRELGRIGEVRALPGGGLVIGLLAFD